MTTTSSDTQSRTRQVGLPWSALLALGTAVFITSLTETLPAGVLPEMSASLGTSSGAAGQAVTVYAAGTALTAIPLATATASVPRKPLLLGAMAVFLVANTLTAAAPGYIVLLAGRFLAGVAAGLAWAILAGYARRIAPAGLEGRAIAVAMTGIPVALSLGVPAGALIGEQVGWRAAFGAVSLLTLAVIGWISVSVPGARQLAIEHAGTNGSDPAPESAKSPCGRPWRCLVSRRSWSRSRRLFSGTRSSMPTSLPTYSTLGWGQRPTRFSSLSVSHAW